MPNNPHAMVIMRPVPGDTDDPLVVIHEECGETVAYLSAGASIGSILNAVNIHVCPEED